jgi:predicted DNA binding protein
MLTLEFTEQETKETKDQDTMTNDLYELTDEQWAFLAHCDRRGYFI